MDPLAFEKLTPAEFIYAWFGWVEHQETLMKQAWERERWSTWVLCSVQLEKKDRLPLTSMFPLPWDLKKTNTEITMEERRRRVSEMIKTSKDV